MHHSLAGPNSLSPAEMTVDARLSELGRILATGIQRMGDRSSAIFGGSGDSSLAILPTRSVSHPRTMTGSEDEHAEW